MFDEWLILSVWLPFALRHVRQVVAWLDSFLVYILRLGRFPPTSERTILLPEFLLWIRFGFLEMASKTRITENIHLNFPLLSSLPFFSSTSVAFLCQIVVISLAWLVGRTSFSLWWVLIAALMWWLAVRSKTKAEDMRRAYDALQNNDQKFVRDRVELLPSWVFFPDTERAEWFNRMLVWTSSIRLSFSYDW